ncbi:MAG: Substrate-binding region of ABC-type glycine betaine transport system [Verrucomicrobiales bacterium]|nr:Substrate-binding region of ABC-type glycine betaine transport system [Verrucomicrobiales bacterium]
MKTPLFALVFTSLLANCATYATNTEIVIGSKKFTESYVLAELAKRSLQQAGFRVDHHQGMGGTIILWEALKQGSIAAYPDYTGTIQQEILKRPIPPTVAALRERLAQYGIGITEELGFNNTYGLVMTKARANELGIRKISDLAKHPDLKLGLTHEFLGRHDGWNPLTKRYGLNIPNVQGVDHSLGYVALLDGEIDLKDAYTTDAKIGENNLVVLQDDLKFFPQYHAVFLYRLDTPPSAIKALRGLEGTLDEAKMIHLNQVAERTKNYSVAADAYFENTGQATTTKSESFMHKLTRWTLRHLELVGLSLAAAIVIGIPLGIYASRPGFVSELILGITGLIQTVPALALLALLVPIPFFGIRPITAIVALFLYGLLPIVRNTATGLRAIPPQMREAAEVLGLNPRTRLLKIFLPLASPSILGGIKTSTIINIGSATLAALIGAGGLGEPIISGLNLNDHTTILEGAIPAALMAIAAQGLFVILDRLLIPRGLQLRPE